MPTLNLNEVFVRFTTFSKNKLSIVYIYATEQRVVLKLRLLFYTKIDLRSAIELDP